MAGAVAAVCSIRIRQRNEVESAYGSDSFLELPYLCEAAYFHTSFERERNKRSYLSHYHLKTFCFVGSILIPARVLVSCWSNTPLHYLSPCFRSCHCLTGNCLLLACVYLNPAHPLEDGSDPTSHRRPAFHFLP